MDFYVAPEDKKNDPQPLAALVLQQDGWDDFGFKTQYHVFYFGPEFNGFVGNVKILQRGQGTSHHSFLPVGPRLALGDDFCSLGQSLDYYERLASLPEFVRRDILTTLRDSLQDPSYAESFHHEEGNRAKGTLEPVAGEGIIHTYFQTLPEETFLVTQTSYADGTLVVSFSVNELVVAAPLLERLTFQIGRLKLDDRLAKSINTFLFELKPGLELLRELPDPREFIKTHLLKAGESFDRSFGLNHWKAAVVRGLAACDGFLDDPWSYLDNEAVFMAELDEEVLL
jgi:hypothetical protein